MNRRDLDSGLGCLGRPPWLFRVDFNGVGGRDGRTIKVVSTLGARPRKGDRAMLVDGERNRCLATVRAVKKGVATLRVDPETWTEPETLRSDEHVHQMAKPSFGLYRWRDGEGVALIATVRACSVEEAFDLFIEEGLVQVWDQVREISGSNEREERP